LRTVAPSTVLRGLRAANRMEREAKELNRKFGVFIKSGSNSWLVSPTRSASKKALLWGGPQEGYGNPNIDVEMYINSKAMHAGGTRAERRPAPLHRFPRERLRRGALPRLRDGVRPRREPAARLHLQDGLLEERVVDRPGLPGVRARQGLRPVPGVRAQGRLAPQLLLRRPEGQHRLLERGGAAGVSRRLRRSAARRRHRLTGVGHPSRRRPL